MGSTLGGVSLARADRVWWHGGAGIGVPWGRQWGEGRLGRTDRVWWHGGGVHREVPRVRAPARRAASRFSRERIVYGGSMGGASGARFDTRPDRFDTRFQI